MDKKIWFVALLAMVLFLIEMSDCQRPVSGVLSATYSSGEPFTAPLFFPTYSSLTGFVYALGRTGVVHRFNGTTLVWHSSLTIQVNGTFRGNQPIGSFVNSEGKRLYAIYTLTGTPATGIPYGAMINLETWQVFNSSAMITPIPPPPPAAAPPIAWPSTSDTVDYSNNIICHTVRSTTTIITLTFNVSTDTITPLAGTAGNQRATTIANISPTSYVTYFSGKNYLAIYTNNFRGFNALEATLTTTLNFAGTSRQTLSVQTVYNGNPFSSSSSFFGTDQEDPFDASTVRAINKGKDIVVVSSISTIQTETPNGVVVSYYSSVSNINPTYMVHLPNVFDIDLIHVDESADPQNSTIKVAFMFSSGRVYKHLYTQTGAQISIESTPYSNENIINGGVILNSLFADTQSKRFLVASKEFSPTTDSKLYSVPFSDCGSRTNCSSCAEMNDPYCGWCVADAKCSYKSSCLSGNLTNGWTKASNLCPDATPVSIPTPISILQGKVDYTFTLSNAPTVSTTYYCLFNRNGKTSVITNSATAPSVTCSLPSILEMTTPSLTETMSISITTDSQGKNILKTFTNAVTVFNCGNRTTCDSCQTTGFSCGWCFLTMICSTFDGCTRPPTAAFSWISNGNCPVITAISAGSPLHHKNRLQSAPAFVTVNVDYLANETVLGASLACNFRRQNGDVEIYDIDEVAYNNMAFIGNNKRVLCQVPIFESILDGKDRENISISISLFGNPDPLAPSNGNSNILIYTCSNRTSCESCVTGDFGCTWSTEFNQCMDDADLNYPLSLENEVKTLGKCPSISSAQTYLIPQGVSDKVRVAGNNFPPPGVLGYKCAFGNGAVTDGTRIDINNVDCDVLPFSAGVGLSQNFTVVVSFGEINITSVGAIPYISFFNCSHPSYAESCLTCVSNSPELAGKCGWCSDESNSAKSFCSRSTQCLNPGLSWSNTACASPSVTSFSPTSGPLQGGTSVIIEGSNLGLSVQSIEYIKIGATGFCKEISWINTNRLRCITDTVNFPQEGAVEVSISGYLPTSSSAPFSFKEVSLTSLTPNQGQVAGGSIVSINGKNMDAGRTVSVRFGDLECRNITRTPNAITCISPPISEQGGKEVDVSINIDELTLTSSFTYSANPTLSSVFPRQAHAGSAINITIFGQNLFESPEVIFGKEPAQVLFSSTTQIIIQLPAIDQSVIEDPEEPLNTPISVKFGTFSISSTTGINIYQDPKIISINPSTIIIGTTNEIFIQGTNLLRGGLPKVIVAEVECFPKTNGSNNNLMRCEIQDPKPGKGPLILEINAIKVTSTDEVTFAEPAQQGNRLVGPIVGSLAGVFLLLLIIGIIIFFIKSKRNKQKREMLFKELDQANDQNMKVLSEVMEAYTEYNTRDKSFSNPLFGNTAVPFTSFESYAVETLFPKDESVSPPALVGFSARSAETQLIADFKKLLLNENFATVFLKTMEKQSDFKVVDRKYTAAILMISLNSNIDYATKLLFLLMKDYISEKVKSGEQKTILRATSTITEKYLTAWLAFTLFSHIQEHFSKPLLNTYVAIKGQIEKGAVDFLTGSSQYTINASSILRQKVNYERIKVKVLYLDKAPVEIEINTCDCVTQVINVALFALEGNTKSAPNVGLYDSNGKLLQDVDSSNEKEADTDFVKLNTMEHYQIKAGSELKLMKKSPEAIDPNLKLFHLEKKVEGAAEQKIAPSEVFFTRMMTMREVIHSQVDSLFDSIFSKESPPAPVKLLFDFLDRTAHDLGVNDSETVHIWKNNSLALRFWVNLVTNPNQIFDINKTIPIHNSLSTIGQVLMDSCSTSELKLGAGAPASKLLYKNEVEEYKKLVHKYYEHVKQTPKPTHHLIASSHQIGEKIDENSALYELRKYANKYSEQIKESLPSDVKAQFERNLQ